MDILDEVEKVVESPRAKKIKVISPKMHGFIDYGHATFFLTMGAIWWKKNKPASIAALSTGAFVLVQSLLTDYPLGAKPVMSFETHGKLDAAFASGSWALPRLLGFAGTPEAMVFEGNSIVEGTVVAMTDWKG